MDIVSNSLEKMKNDLEKCKSEEKEEEEENLKFEIQTDHLTARFKMEKQLNCSEKQEKNDIDIDTDEEDRIWRIQDADEFVCHICGLRGHRFLDFFSGCSNQQEVAHRYCALKEIKDESLEAKDESLEAKVMSVELSELFKRLRKTKTSVIDYFIRRNSSD